MSLREMDDTIIPDADVNDHKLHIAIDNTILPT